MRSTQPVRVQESIEENKKEEEIMENKEEDEETRIMRSRFEEILQSNIIYKRNIKERDNS